LYLLDANVLIYAFRRDSPHHSPCYQWLTNTLAGEDPVATTSVVELALLRIATLPALGTAASTPAEVFRFLGALKDQPTVLRIEPGEQHLDILSGLCAKMKLRGNDINDIPRRCRWNMAQHLSRPIGVSVVSRDCVS
jgi:toxin-antitoxin system PIN domain toxin